LFKDYGFGKLRNFTTKDLNMGQQLVTILYWYHWKNMYSAYKSHHS